MLSLFFKLKLVQAIYVDALELVTNRPVYHDKSLCLLQT